MPNAYFKFKKFTIRQEKAAMKVCTDACLFGAWVAAKIENENFKEVLDIGTGTGLLSLMLAQKNNANIEAIELNESAVVQAGENFANSPWANRIKVFQTDLFYFNPTKRYDFIISNPPFFENDLKSDDSSRNAAMHSTTLNLQNLLKEIKRMLTVNGKAAVLIPFKRSEYFEKLLNENDFFIEEALHVKQSVDHDYFRSMYIFSFVNNAKINRTEIAIHDRQKQYSSEFIQLLKEYYLKL